MKETIYQPLIPCPDSSDSQAWAGLKPGTRPRSPVLVAWTQLLGPSPPASQGALTGSWDGSPDTPIGAGGILRGVLLLCQMSAPKTFY